MVIADTATGLVLLVAGLLSGRPAGRVLLVAAALAWFAGDLSAGAAYLHRGPLVQLVMAYPSLWPRSARGRAATSPGPGELIRSAVIVAGYLGCAVPSLTASPAAAFALSAALVATAAGGFAVASGPWRRARAVALGGAAALAVALSAGPLLVIAGLPDDAFLVPYDVLIAVTAALLAADLRWGRWARDTAADLVVDLGQPGPLRDRLARALGDPGLVLGFWVPARGEYVDEAGHRVDVASAGGRMVTFLGDDGQGDGARGGNGRVGVLVHDMPALAGPALVADVARAARLALANVRLREDVRARAAEVATSRRRLVEAADTARRELAGDLRSGPGRHLAAAADVLLGTGDEAGGGAGFAGSDPELATLARRLLVAQAVVRDLAAGIDPPALAAAGLGAALRALAGLSAVPVSLSVPPARFPASVETAAYFVCAEALANIARHSRAATASLRVWESGGRLHLEVRDDGAGGALMVAGAGPGAGSGLRGLADRVAALGGTLTVDSPPGAGTRLTAELPLSDVAAGP